ncbi:MAG: CPBP family intramembrane metalloprotease [Planctomycetes bacterium]|nr:CPBP family intramembrane metalloprotease [Planctomycetota bacterium]
MSGTGGSRSEGSRGPAWPLLAVFCLLPAIQTATAVWLEILPAVTYPLLKAVMIAVPLAVWRWRGLGPRGVAARIGLTRPRPLAGAGIGAAMAAIIAAGYVLVLRGAVDGAGIAAKVDSLGLREHYWAMAVVISLANAAFEEYYWRGFLLSELRPLAGGSVRLIVLAGGLFGLHHLFALAPMLAWPLAAGCTAVTMVAGGFWAWMRVRGFSLADVYVSHILADLAIMGIGWDLLQQAARG